MKTALYLMLMASGLGIVCLAERHSDRWPVREEETIDKTLTLSGEPRRLLIDNLEGFVHVTATNSPQVHVIAHKTIRAETETDLQQAKSEVKLEMTEKPGMVSVYYDAPWRCEHGNCGHQERRFYTVVYDIEVQTPRDVRPVVSTVNDGDVRVDGTTGDFDVSNVNGAISMTDVSGSGDAHTINGSVTVHLTKNPTQASSFKSINGSLDVYFQPDLSADLRFKTMNGQIFSDFEVTPLQAVATADADQRNGRYVYRSNGRQGARVGHGGTEIDFDTLNGNIRVHRAGN
jgi:hypothetical protein